MAGESRDGIRVPAPPTIFLIDNSPLHRRRAPTLRPATPLRMWIVTALFKPLAYVSVPYLILKYATETNPTARYCFRVVVYYSALGFCSVWGMIVAVGMSLAGHRLDINWVVARSFYTLAGKMLDIKFIVEGEEHLDVKPAVLVGNHQSGLDILFLGRYAQVLVTIASILTREIDSPPLSCSLPLRGLPRHPGFSRSTRPSWPKKSWRGLRYWVDILRHRVRSLSTEEITRQLCNR